eukprot:2822749-Amphidinium_carterae.1
MSSVSLGKSKGSYEELLMAHESVDSRGAAIQERRDFEKPCVHLNGEAPGCGRFEDHMCDAAMPKSERTGQPIHLWGGNHLHPQLCQLDMWDLMIFAKPVVVVASASA